jgi:hypothetical protein
VFAAANEYIRNCHTPKQEAKWTNKIASNVRYAGIEKTKHEPHVTLQVKPNTHMAAAHYQPQRKLVGVAVVL